MAEKTRYVDLSVPIEESESEPMKPQVVHMDHAAGAQVMSAIFGIPAADLPGGLGWANDNITLVTHAGTHLDAPWHYAPTAGGDRAWTIEEVPLEWCFSDGVVLDFRAKPDGEAVSSAECAAELDRIGYEVKPLDIVLIMTGTDKHWGSPDYINRGCGMTKESTTYFLDRGVKVMGIDAWGFDRPFVSITDEYKQTGDASIIWEAHYAGIETPYCHLEKLANLDMLPPFGFRVACFPVKITGASAGWCRPVGIIEE
jgi:kynurenine formamidase